MIRSLGQNPTEAEVDEIIRNVIRTYCMMKIRTIAVNSQCLSELYSIL